MNISKAKEIEQLLVKFEQGDTSEAEEMHLRDFFRQEEDIPSEWKPYRELFLSFETSAYDFSDEELDAMLGDSCDATDIPSSVARINKPNALFLRRWKYAAAAVVVCTFGLSALYYLNIQDTSHSSVERQTAFQRTMVRSDASAQEHAPKQISLSPTIDPSGVDTSVAEPLKDVANVRPSHIRTKSISSQGKSTLPVSQPETIQTTISNVGSSLSGTVMIASREIVVGDTHQALDFNPCDVPESIQMASFLDTSSDTLFQTVAPSSQAAASATAHVGQTYNQSSSIALALPNAQLMPGK